MVDDGCETCQEVTIIINCEAKINFCSLSTEQFIVEATSLHKEIILELKILFEKSIKQINNKWITET